MDNLDLSGWHFAIALFYAALIVIELGVLVRFVRAGLADAVADESKPPALP